MHLEKNKYFELVTLYQSTVTISFEMIHQAKLGPYSILRYVAMCLQTLTCQN